MKKPGKGVIYSPDEVSSLHFTIEKHHLLRYSHPRKHWWWYEFELNLHWSWQWLGGVPCLQCQCGPSRKVRVQMHNLQCQNIIVFFKETTIRRGKKSAESILNIHRVWVMSIRGFSPVSVHFHSLQCKVAQEVSPTKSMGFWVEPEHAWHQVRDFLYSPSTYPWCSSLIHICWDWIIQYIKQLPIFRAPGSMKYYVVMRSTSHEKAIYATYL